MEQSPIESSLEPTELKNHYWALRHGTSEANQLGIIACSPFGIGQKFGLIEDGRQIVRRTLEQALVKYPQLKNCIFYVSPLKRTVETSDEASLILQPKEIHIVSELRERDFSKYDGQSAKFYPEFWKVDQQDPHEHPYDGESAWEVRNRVVSLIHQIETQHRNQQILLISHGDPLQIVEAAFKNINPSLHREAIQHLNPGELRKLN